MRLYSGSCLTDDRSATIAARLSNAAITTNNRITGALSSSSTKREQICSADRLIIQMNIRTRNRSTPAFHAISTRLMPERWAGRTR